MDYDDRTAQLTELAFLDESESYEVDYTFIGLDAAGKFVLLTASGCSCWDGDYDEATFDTLDALASSLIDGDEDGNDKYRYNPSLVGAKQAVEDARKSLERIAIDKQTSDTR